MYKPTAPRPSKVKLTEAEAEWLRKQAEYLNRPRGKK